jgi:hypothetical protein
MTALVSFPVFSSSAFKPYNCYWPNSRQDRAKSDKRVFRHIFPRPLTKTGERDERLKKPQTTQDWELTDLDDFADFREVREDDGINGRREEITQTVPLTSDAGPGRR